MSNHKLLVRTMPGHYKTAAVLCFLSAMALAQDQSKDKTEKLAPVTIKLSGDLPGVRPYFDKVAKKIASADLSPTSTPTRSKAQHTCSTAMTAAGVRNKSWLRVTASPMIMPPLR